MIRWEKKNKLFSVETSVLATSTGRLMTHFPHQQQPRARVHFLNEKF